MSVERAGMLALMFLPFGLSALWAPLVDRYHLPSVGRRKSWIVPCQLVVAAALLAAAISGPANPALLVGAMVVLSIAAATMDVALDGYMAETASPRQRISRGGLKVGGMLLGTALGSMFVLAVIGRLGWSWTIAIVALLSAAAVVPFALSTEQRGAQIRGWPSLARVLALPAVAPRLGLLATLGVCLGIGIAACRLSLIQKGFALPAIGTIFGPVASLAGLAGAVVGTVLGRAFGLGTLLFAAGATFFAAMAMLPMVPVGIAYDAVLAGSVVGAAVLAYGALYGCVSAMAMGWVGDRQAATDYAVAQSIWTLMLVIGSAAAGFGLSVLGTTVLPAAGACAMLAVALLLLIEATGWHDLEAARR